MDGLSFHKVIKILKKRYLGCSINRVSVLKDHLYISIYKDGQVVLLFKASPPPSLEKTDVAMGESAAVLANLSGAVITEISSRQFDRLGWFTFEKRRPSGKLMQYKLMLEPMGNYANAFLLGDEGTILYRLSAKNIDPDRDTGVGKIYSLPRLNKRFTLDDYQNCLDFNEYLGFYPLTAKMAAEYAEKYGHEKAVEIIRGELENNRFYINEKGKILPFPPVSGAESVDFDEMRFVAGANNESSDRKLADKLKKFYQKQLDHYLRLKEKLHKEYEKASNHDQLSQEARLIKANLHLIKGKGVYELVEYGEEGAHNIKYEYKSDDTPSAYADKLYKRASKLNRALPMLEERISQAAQLAESANEQLFYVENADAQELKELAELQKEKPSKTGKKQDSGFNEYKYGGASVYIGRNSAGNHRLVFQFAQAGDLWLHAQNIPSAHCIIRSDAKITDDILLFAARLTAAHSKNKLEQRVPIDYCLKKYVRKPKNTPVGFVIYNNFKTIDAKPFDEDELKLLHQ